MERLEEECRQLRIRNKLLENQIRELKAEARPSKSGLMSIIEDFRAQSASDSEFNSRYLAVKETDQSIELETAKKDLQDIRTILEIIIKGEDRSLKSSSSDLKSILTDIEDIKNLVLEAYAEKFESSICQNQ